MSHFEYDEGAELSFWRRRRVTILVVSILVGGGLVAATQFKKGPAAAPRRESTMVAIKLPPPPPPPPPPQAPPPPPQQQPEEKMIAQEPVKQDEPKPDDKPPDQPPDLGTGIRGDGPADGFGLSGNGGGMRLGGTGSGGAGSRSKWGWYAGQVQSRVADALKSHRKTRRASINSIQVKVWPDQTGRISRAQLASSTGDASLDAAITGEVLTGLQLREPPPQGMPSPIVLRIAARRP